MTQLPGLGEDTIQTGAPWSHALQRGTALRITDTEGGANVGATFYNFDRPVERYNMADTLKAQHIARLTKGFVSYSDMGRFFSRLSPIRWVGTTRSAGPPIGNWSRRDTVFEPTQKCATTITKVAATVSWSNWGLGPRDLMANLNFFSRVNVDSDGPIGFDANNSKAGDYIELRAEMNLLAILNTCQHPLDPNPKYEPKPVQLAIRTVAAAGADDSCRISRPENGRGFTLTERYFLEDETMISESVAEKSSVTHRVESKLDPAQALHRHVVPAGESWVHEIVGASACVSSISTAIRPWTRSSITRVQARPHQQHQFLHECSGQGGRQAHVRGRNLRALNASHSRSASL